MRVVSDLGPVVRTVVVGQPTDVGGLAALLAGLDGEFEVIGPVWPPAEVFTHVLQHAPDLVLVDYASESSETRDLVRTVRGRFPAIKVIVLGAADSVDEVREAIRLGVSAFLPRNCDAECLTAAVYALRGGHMVIGTQAAKTLFGAETSRVPLRRAEQQVLRLLADGLTYDEITAQLAISRSTLKRYLRAIETKLNARNRVQAVALAAKQGLI